MGEMRPWLDRRWCEGQGEGQQSSVFTQQQQTCIMKDGAYISSS